MWLSSATFTFRPICVHLLIMKQIVGAHPLGQIFLMGITWSTIRATNNLIIGFCLENWALSNDMQQHTIRRHSWALEPNSILLGPSRAPSGSYMLIPVWVSLARFTFRPICVHMPILKQIVGAHPLGPNFWWALPETLLALQAIWWFDFVWKIESFRMIYNNMQFNGIPGHWSQTLSKARNGP